METTILKQLALAGGLQEPVNISMADLARRCNAGHGAVSRMVSEMVEAGLLAQELEGKKRLLLVTQEGEEVLAGEFREYCRIFSTHRQSIIRGRLVSGLGEGKYYISQERYIKQFEVLLGFKPYPGTLNLQLSKPFIEPRTRILVEGFNNGGRTFGVVRCYPSKIRDIKTSVIRPERTHYPDDFLEVISPVNLRESLGLDEGDVVEVEILG